MSYLVDTNVLLRSVHKTNPTHELAVRAIKFLLDQDEELYITPQNLVEFWAVATRPTNINGLGLTVAQTARRIPIFKRGFKLRPDAPEIFSEWEKLVIQHQVKGKPTHDARLVAAMQTYGITHLLTFNTEDFKRFIHISVVDPVTIA